MFSSLTSLPSGLFLDKFGPSKLIIMGGFFFGAAFVLFGLSSTFCTISKNLHSKFNLIPNQILAFDGYIASFILMGVGCPSIYLSLLKIAYFFPQKISTILSFVNCAFDASVFIFYIFKVIFYFIFYLNLNLNLLFNN